MVWGTQLGNLEDTACSMDANRGKIRHVFMIIFFEFARGLKVHA